MVTKEAQKKEAISRLETLTKTFRLNPNILKYFKEGKLYYSYLTAGGFMSSIDTINYDPKYARAVNDFESCYGGLVYHAVETMTAYGKMLSLLYVGKRQDEWPVECLNGEDIMTYTINLDEDMDEFGYIGLDSINGVLVRTR